MIQQLPVKKRLSLHWQGAQVELDVAQELFSSHQIDRGSKMLLASLESLTFPEHGNAVDFGCGYGVLGIAWQATHSDWSMHYVDRDALAVAFARHNVARSIPSLADRAVYTHDATPPRPPEDGFDLVLWNVPGKAGADVLKVLTQIILDGLGQYGLLAMVVVNPLADVMRLALKRIDVTCERDDTGRDHTVLHIRKRTADVSWHDAFAAGVFDRSEAQFSLRGHSWRLVPVTGLPEYDSLGHSSVLAGELMLEVARTVNPGRLLVHESGNGHLAVLAGQLWPDSAGVVSGRDALALLATERTMRQNCPGVRLELRPVWGPPELADPSIAAQLAVVALPDQVQAGELQAMATALTACLAPGGVAIVHGGSTEVGRLERLLGQDRRWRVGKRAKAKGSAAIPIFQRF